MKTQLSLRAVRIFATPIPAAALLIAFAYAAFAQQSGAGPERDAADTVFRAVGYVATMLGLFALSIAAIYGLWKSQALKEARELARTRYEANLELKAEKADLLVENKELKRENERLAKKNLRLQSPSDDEENGL